MRWVKVKETLNNAHGENKTVHHLISHEYHE